MMTNSIIPKKQVYIKNGLVYESFPNGDELDYESIAIWLAIGFFINDSTFYRDVKVLPPATSYNNGKISKPYWKWRYTPRDVKFSQIVDEFQFIFEKSIKDAVKDMDIILPISGGLDSRTLAVACKDSDKTHFCSWGV